jgi:hypothetical protein
MIVLYSVTLNMYCGTIRDLQSQELNLILRHSNLIPKISQKLAQTPIPEKVFLRRES